MTQADSENEAVEESRPAVHNADTVSQHAHNVGIVSARWEGPLPPSPALRQYEDAHPGLAERIVRMAEKQVDSRIRTEERAIEIEGDRVQTEKTAVVADSRRGYIGLIFGFILSLTIISAGAYIAVSVQPWVGASIIGGNIAGLAGVFVYGTNARRRERERKASEPQA